MKPIPTTLALSATLLTLPCYADLFPNGDFESAGSTWLEVAGGGTFTFDYPATGGNDDGYGIIDHSAADGGFGIWVGNDGQPLTLASLNLEAGSTYDFTLDMRLISGTNIGGFKLDFTNGGDNAVSTGDLRNDLIGDGSTWETYTFRIEIPGEGVDGFKVVPLWGVDSVVGFDNIGFDPTPIVPPVEPPVIEPGSEAQVAEGTLVTWVPTNTEKLHQPQSSQDGTAWTNLGPAFPGTETTTILDPNPAPFYRVQEKDPAGPDSVVNGGFEIADPGNPDCPENWTCIFDAGQAATRIETDSYSGTASVRLAVQNDDGAAPNKAEIQQNLGIAGGSVTPGETYTFSFRAKQISSGVSYVQQYRLQWVDGSGAAINGADIGFNNFSGGSGTWDEISPDSIVAPAGAVSAFIQIFGATGAVAGADARGEVLIDDISLAVGGATEPSNLATTTEPGIGVTMLTKSGVTYKAQQSNDLFIFDDLTGTFTGNGTFIGAGIPEGGPSHYFRILEIPAEDN